MPATTKAKKDRLLNKDETMYRLGATEGQLEKWRRQDYINRIGRQLGYPNGAVKVGRAYHYRESVIDHIVEHGLNVDGADRKRTRQRKRSSNGKFARTKKPRR